jgi:hypothetical protein
MQLLETVSWRALTAVGLGALVFVASRGTAPSEPAPVVEIADVAPAIDEPATATDSSTNEDAPAPIYFTFTADHARWVALAPLPKPAYKSPRELKEDYLLETIATPSPRDVAVWRDRELVVDGGCREKLETFAVIARLSGEPVYANDDGAPEWTAQSIMKNGEPVLAAKLKHCTQGEFASTVPVRRLEHIDDAELVARARAVMVASSFAAKAVADWKAMTEPKPWTDDAEFDAIVARDTVRDVTWVSMHVHANGIGCGAPTTNFWGLFRVAPDGSLERVTLRALDNVGSLSDLVDLDGTGEPSLLGEALLPTGPIAIDPRGEQTAGDTPPFYGCPC